MQWFKIPPQITLKRIRSNIWRKCPDIERAFIVTDATMVKLGYVDRILYFLRKRPVYCHSEIYSDVEPDPDVSTIRRGVEAMRAFQPDVSSRSEAVPPSTRQRACGCFTSIRRLPLTACG